jgi:hypothetical protein
MALFLCRLGAYRFDWHWRSPRSPFCWTLKRFECGVDAITLLNQEGQDMF